MFRSILLRIFSWLVPQRQPAAETSSIRSFYYEGTQLIFPVLYFKQSTDSNLQPHVLQTEPNTEASPILYLGAHMFLEFPDGQRQSSFIAGVVYATPFWCKIALVVLVGNKLELTYLCIRRSFLGLGTIGFPSLVSWEYGYPQWTFFPIYKILYMSRIMCSGTPRPRLTCEVFLQRWYSLMREHQEFILGPTELMFAEEPLGGTLVRTWLSRLFGFSFDHLNSVGSWL